MKQLLIIAILIPMLGFGQEKKEALPSSETYLQKVEHKTAELTILKTDTVLILLTDWQQQQFKSLEEQKKAIDEQIRFLTLTIIDSNKIKFEEVADLRLQNGKLVVIRRKKE
jgi:hypothetical protein